ncbi:hypothetical protein [Streptomyces sp. NPDC048638]|uniref:hypothetical protein n=1 Tax=Streptomyces sp. NPDC048638 TaxID=3365580 RepID=UPI00371415D0
MPTAIAVTSPDLALPADRQTPAAVVLQAPQLQPLDDALTETAAVLEHHGHLVVLYSAACPADHIRRLHTLRSVLESDRIAIVPLSLPPLGLAVLARQLRQLSLCGFSAGLLAGAARLLAHYIHAGALLGSVSGLDRVEVDLRAHMKSWLPGAHFAVLAHPEPRLQHLDRHGTGAAPPGPGFATQLALARGHLTAEWVDGVLAPAWRVQGVYETRLPAESARWWGTQKLIEFAAAIPDPAVLHQLVSSVRREACRWCGLELIGDRCTFCATPAARDGVTVGAVGVGQQPAAIAGPPAGPVGPAATAPAPAAPVAPTAPTAPTAPASVPAAPAPPPAPTPPPPAPTPSAAPPPPAPAPPPSPLHQRGLSPVAPSGAPGVPGGPGVPGAPGTPGVRGAAPGQLDVRGPGVTNAPPTPGVRDLPGHPDFPGSARTVAHVR